MKKINLFAPILTIATLGGVASTASLTGCSKNNDSLVSQQDINFVEGLNEVLENYQSELFTCYRAWTLATEYGYNLANYKLSSSECEFTFDMNAKKFIIMHNDDVVYAPKSYKKPENNFDLWRFVDLYNPNSRYSQCLKDDYYVSNTNDEMIVKTGIDVGSNKNIINMKYVGDANNPKTVTICTYADMLTIDAQNDCINHFGKSSNIYLSGNGPTKATYREVGSAAYVKAENVNFVVGYAADNVCCSIDTFEAVSSVTGARDRKYYGHVWTSVGEKIEALNADYVLEPKNISSIDELIDISSSCFVRLNSDLNFKDSTKSEKAWNLEASTNSLRIILDLNGHIISDEDETTLAVNKPRISISANCSLSLMDSQRSTSNGLVLCDHYIQVEGDSTNAANFLLNGANIAYYACGTIDPETQKANNRGAIYVGHTEAGTTTNYFSNFYMYGGSVNAFMETTDENAGCVCISPRNSGAYVQIIYGSVYSDQICLSGNGLYNDTFVDITGGVFVAGNKFPCIYIPQTGTLDITGGTFVGGTNLTIRAGVLKISGGNFLAYGDHSDPESGKGAAVIDGSNILVDGNNSYSKLINITVSGSSMYSLNSYIVKCIGQSDWSGYGDIDFFGGNFLYKLGSNGCGIDINVKKHFSIDQVKGNWIRHN